MQQITDIAIGTDTELFLQDKTTQEIISAEGFIQGTKHNPFVFDNSNKFFATSLDNVLCEFCIPPATSAEQFYNNIMKSMNYINNVIPEQYCTVAIPAARLNERWLQTWQAKTFGCESDFSAYSQEMNQPIWCEDELLRSAGMHLHLSYALAETYNPYQYKPDETRCNIIKAFDLHLGVPAVLMEPDSRRKELYGRAGSFRPKPYGVEYRTLSNYFVNDKGKIVWCYDSLVKAVNWLNAGNIVDDELATFIQGTINTNDKENAKQLIERFNLQTA